MAASDAVRVDGLRELHRGLKEAGRSVSDLTVLHREVGQLVAREGSDLAPVLDGLLAASVRAVATPTGVTVIAGSNRVDYAGVQHFGWVEHNIEPTPFLYDAFDTRRAQVLDRYESGINKITDRI